MGKKVLLVDDDEQIQMFLRVALEENGYQAILARDGKEGLSKVRDERPDLIVLDVMMPKKSGFTLFKQLRKDGELKGIPIIMLTGVAGVLADLDERKGETEEKPFDSLKESLRKMIDEMRDEGLGKPEMFLDKPIDPEAFIKKVKEILAA